MCNDAGGWCAVGQDHLVALLVVHVCSKQVGHSVHRQQHSHGYQVAMCLPCAAYAYATQSDGSRLQRTAPGLVAN